MQVSPQFIHVPSSCTGVQRSRRARNSTVSTQRQTHSWKHQTQNQTLPATVVNDKYKPLDFLGEKSPDDDMTSICEDVSVEEISILNVNEYPLRKNQPSPSTSFQSRSKTCSNNSVDSLSPSQKQLSKDIQVEVGNNSPGPISCDFGDIDTPDILPLRLEPLLSHDRTNTTDQFTSINSQPKEESPSVTMETEHRSSSPNRRKSHRRLFGIESTRLENHRNKPTRNRVDDTCNFDSIPRRRSQRLRTLKNEFFGDSQLSTPVDRFKQPVEVLVYDTPEEDYGMPVRRRRLRDYQLCNIGINR